MSKIFQNKAGLVLPPHLVEAKARKPVVVFFFRSDDIDKNPNDWEPVKLKDVPKWVQEEGVVAAMMLGNCIQDEAKDPHWWGAKRVEVQSLEANRVLH
jgi:hypothetical protein